MGTRVVGRAASCTAARSSSFPAASTRRCARCARSASTSRSSCGAARARTSRTSTAIATSTGSCRGARSSSVTPTTRPSTRWSRRRSDGTSFGAPTEAEVELAAEIVDAVPSVEKVRLVSSGTEAAMSAVRLARAFTSRDRILKFAGCYHGHVDALLASAGSGVRDARHPVEPRRPAPRHRAHDRLSVQRRRRCGRRGRALRRGSRGDHRRADRREHGRRAARARLPRRRCAASATAPARCWSSTR